MVGVKLKQFQLNVELLTVVLAGTMSVRHVLMAWFLAIMETDVFIHLATPVPVLVVPHVILLKVFARIAALDSNSTMIRLAKRSNVELITAIFVPLKLPVPLV